jgi:hypothetical protein
MKILFDPFEEAEKLAAQNGRWVVGVIQTRVYWPHKRQLMNFKEKQFLLLPLENNAQFNTPTLPAIALRADLFGLTDADARREILQFASAVSWKEGQKIEVVQWSGGNLPRSMGIMQNNGQSEYLSDDFLPISINENAKTALAFYREGVSLDNPFYAFLSFYKAFSISISNPKERKSWLTSNKSRLDSIRSRERLSELENLQFDIGIYLYDQGRNAVAHADKEPFVNPDNADDHARFIRDLPLMQNFVELSIEEKFAIKRPSTIYRDHLYELSGFRDLLPERALNFFKFGTGSLDDLEIEIPESLLIIARRGHQQFSLGEMKILSCHANEEGLVIQCESSNTVICIRLSLDFKNERLKFDPLIDLQIKSKKETHEQISEELMGIRFYRAIFSNGELEVWDSSREKKLGCSGSYMPINMFMDMQRMQQAEDDLIARLNK